MTNERCDADASARVTITKAYIGWEVRAELDSQIVRLVRCTDWHRVERAVAVLRAAFADLDDPDPSAVSN